MRLAEKTGCGYNELMRNVRILEHEGVVVYRRDGRKCFVSLNRDSLKARILIKALRILDAPINSRQPRREKDNGILRGDKRLDKSDGPASEENEDHVFYGEFGVFCASTSNVIAEISKA
ncbi:hypothetical protein G4O51_07140 [Candidatus Bathyarchaeota archaeon A05DMB-2]|jgi:hypothetical protein|nr:hypothetical protein [Candidatus Bathyarchaeota archaeon A05DMB-2]